MENRMKGIFAGHYDDGRGHTADGTCCAWVISDWDNLPDVWYLTDDEPYWEDEAR